MFWIKNSAADWIEYYWHLCYNLLSPKFVILKQSLQREQIICICADICTFPDLHYRHEQTSAPFDKVSIWSKERAERTVPSLGGHCKQANSAIFCSPLWPSGEIQDSLKVEAVICWFYWCSLPKYFFNQYGYRRLDAIHKLEWGGPSHFLVSGCTALRTDGQWS